MYYSTQSHFAKPFFRPTGLFVFTTAVILLLTCSQAYLPIASAATGKVTILHTNDMHSHMLGFGPNGEYTPEITGDDQTVGGIARIAGKVADIRTDRANIGTPVLLLDGGDFMMGTAFSLLKGKAEINLMTHLGYDAITIGNHEFDWTPAGTAQIYSYISAPMDLPVVASNLIFDDTHPGDDALKALWDAEIIQPCFTKPLTNGLNVGFFGLIGEDAVSVAPFAHPVDFDDRITAAQAMVNELDSVDLVICLSHSGIEEDSTLASAVPGIDVIISGHTHETTQSPVIVGDTIIVQGGSYTKHLGILDLDVTESGVSVDDFELVAIDDSIEGDTSTHNIVEQLKDEVDSTMLTDLGYGFDEAIAETAFDLTATAGKEANLGNLVTDAMRWMVDQVEYDPADPTTKVDFAIESNGVIRDDILKGDSGLISFSDAFRVLPLGFGLEEQMAVGYPMVTIYVTASEVKKALEVLTTLYPMRGSDFWLNVSGLKVKYAPNGIPFFRVKNIYVGDDENGYSDTPLDTSCFNQKLYKVAINYYVAQFIAVVGDYTFGILSVDPKDRNGISYNNTGVHPNGLDEARVDIDPEDPGIQELRQWEGFMKYFTTFDDPDADDIPGVPAGRYEAPTGRITETSCFISTLAN